MQTDKPMFIMFLPGTRATKRYWSTRQAIEARDLASKILGGTVDMVFSARTADGFTMHLRKEGWPASDKLSDRFVWYDGDRYYKLDDADGWPVMADGTRVLLKYPQESVEIEVMPKDPQEPAVPTKILAEFARRVADQPEADDIDLSKYGGLTWIFKFAEKHGIDSEPDHEVGDLQFALGTAWNMLSPAKQWELVGICKGEWGNG